MTEQLNKIQLKAELLTVITKLQTISDTSKVESIIEVLAAQENKKQILDLLMREFVKTNEDKAFILSYLMLRLTEKEQLENQQHYQTHYAKKNQHRDNGYTSSPCCRICSLHAQQRLRGARTHYNSTCRWEYRLANLF